MLMKEGKI